ncbi:hypothetical protein [Brevundimonas sp.]|uniref:hypothetical protein n=1 Tax=Brevundimonas sp. TaxID=1871086 RepID=UPI003F6EA781
MTVDNDYAAQQGNNRESKPAQVTILETSPDSITWHKIWDYELDSLVNISRPITSSLSTTAIGAWIGLTPSFLVTFEKIRSGQTITLGDASNAGLWIACFCVGAVLSFFAIRAHLDAKKVKEAIRGRLSKPV